MKEEKKETAMVCAWVKATCWTQEKKPISCRHGTEAGLLPNTHPAGGKGKEKEKNQRHGKGPNTVKKKKKKKKKIGMSGILSDNMPS